MKSLTSEYSSLSGAISNTNLRGRENFMSKTQTKEQPGWGTCTQCGGLFFKPHAKTRACKAGGVHQFVDERKLLYVDAVDANGNDIWVDNPQVGANQEASWAWCEKCRGLFFVSNNGGLCQNGKHDKTGSSTYLLTKVNGTPNPGSGSYYQCSRCFGLYADLASGTKCNGGKAHEHRNANQYYTLDPDDDIVD